MSKNFEKENIVKPHYYPWNSTKIDPARSFLGAFSQFLFRIVYEKCFLVFQRNFKEMIEIIHSVFNFYQSHCCDVNKITCLHERADGNLPFRLTLRFFSAEVAVSLWILSVLKSMQSNRRQQTGDLDCKITYLSYHRKRITTNK